MFEFMRRIENIEVFKKNLISAATPLVESIVSRSQRIAFSGDKIGYFQTWDLYHEPMDNSNFRSLSMRPQKLKNCPTYPSASGCADSKISPELPRRPVDLLWQNLKILYIIFHKKALSELQKIVVQFFNPDPGWKLSCENS